MAPPSRRGGFVTHWIGARPTPGATALLVVELAAFIVYLFLDSPEWLVRHLVLVPREALWNEPWQILTTAVLHIRGAKLLSSAIGIWIFATAVEQRTSRGRMLFIFGAAQLAGAVTFAVTGRLFAPGQPFDGCAPGVDGLVIAFGVYYARVPLRLFGAIEMRGQSVAALVLGLSLFIGLLNRDFVGLMAAIVAIATGWAIASGAGARIGVRWERLKLWRLRRRYRVIPGGRDSKKFLN